MSDRLAELVRQRALVQEHLAWLNREIATAAEAAKAVAPTKLAPETSPSPTVVSSPASTPSDILSAGAKSSPTLAGVPTSTDPDEIIARYQVAPGMVKQDVRKGCLLYFVGAFVLLGLVVTVLYLAIGQSR